MLCNVSSSSEMRRINMFYSLTRPGRYPRNLRIVRIVGGLLWPSNVWVSFDNRVVTGGCWCQMAGWGGWAIITEPDWAANNHLTRRGRRPLWSGQKLQEITTNWCQAGPGSWLLFIVTKPLIKQLHTFQPPPWPSFNLCIPGNKVSHLSPLTTEHVLTSDLPTYIIHQTT